MTDYIRLLQTRFAKGALAVALLYLLYLGGYANSRCRVWQNDTTLKKELKELATPTDTLLKPLTSSTAAMMVHPKICMQKPTCRAESARQAAVLATVLLHGCGSVRTTACNGPSEMKEFL